MTDSWKVSVSVNPPEVTVESLIMEAAKRTTENEEKGWGQMTSLESLDLAEPEAYNLQTFSLWDQ